jgi:hypothetical protein
MANPVTIGTNATAIDNPGTFGTGWALCWAYDITALPLSRRLRRCVCNDQEQHSIRFQFDLLWCEGLGENLGAARKEHYEMVLDGLLDAGVDEHLVQRSGACDSARF